VSSHHRTQSDVEARATLVTWHECELCRVPSAFFLDHYNGRQKACRMRAMDHNHTLQSTSVVKGFAELGLIPHQ
jgi:hypothetical protein